MARYVELPAEFYQFYLVEAGDRPEVSAITNGLVTGVKSAVARVHTGINFGPVLVAVDVLASGPDEPDASFEWEEIAGVGAEVTGTKDLYLLGFDLLGPVADPPPAGPVRVRVHCLGRDENRDLAVETASERYLLQVWPALQPGEEEILLQTDSTGRQLRASGALLPPQRIDDA